MKTLKSIALNYNNVYKEKIVKRVMIPSLEDDLHKMGIKEGDLLEIVLTKDAKYRDPWLGLSGWKGELLRALPLHYGNKIAGYFKGFEKSRVVMSSFQRQTIYGEEPTEH